jgi:hypothetical protein
MGATVMLVMRGYTCERLFGYRNALVERVSIEISKAKTKKDARLGLEMTRPVTAAASTSLRSFRTYLLVVPAHRAQLRTSGGDGGGCGPKIIVSNTRGDRP